MPMLQPNVESKGVRAFRTGPFDALLLRVRFNIDTQENEYALIGAYGVNCRNAHTHLVSVVTDWVEYSAIRESSPLLPRLMDEDVARWLLDAYLVDWTCPMDGDVR